MRHTRGLTLIELLAVVALLALVSVMAAQALSMGLVQARGLARGEARQAELARALGLLRQDLGAAIDLRLLTGGGAPAFEPGIGSAGLSRGGMPDLALADLGEAAGVQRLRWRHDPGAARLYRQLSPLEGGGREGPETLLLEGVTGFRLAPLGDWQSAPEGLPAGFEARIETRDFGSLRIVVAR